MMNYEYIRKNNSQRYKKLFSVSNLVISIPFSIPLGPRILNNSNSLLFRKKIPTKMYMGMSREFKLESISFGEVYVYDNNSEKFSMKSINQIIDDEFVEDIKKCMNSLLHEHGIEEGFYINLLIEQSDWNYSEIISMILTLFSSFLVGYLDGRNNLGNFKGKILKQFEIINDLVLKNTNALLLTKTVIHEGYDIRIQKSSKKNDGYVSREIERFKGIMGYSSCIDVFDYGVISFGFDNKFPSTGKISLGHNGGENFYKASSFQSDLLGFEHEKNLIGYSNILKKFELLAKQPTDEACQKSVVNAVGNAGFIFATSGKEHDLLVQLYSLFDRIKSGNDEYIGFLPIGLRNGGGVFFFITLKYRSRNSLPLIKDEVHQNGYRNVLLPFQSRIDGTIFDGLMIEQCIDHAIFSEYISTSSVFIETDGDKKIEQHDVGIANLNQKVLLDAIFKKVFYKGKKLTYKDLRSQSSTVEILLYLIKNKKRIVRNSELPPSSYSKNKNEMLGKIVYPLTNFMAENGFEVEIQCEGNLYDFYLGLKKGSEHFALLTSIFD